MKLAWVLAVVIATTACGGAVAAKSPSPSRAPRGGETAMAESDGDRVADAVDRREQAVGYEPGAPATQSPAPPPPPKAPQPEDKPAEKPAHEAHDRSLLVYTARVTMAVYQVDQGLSTVERLAQESGGYLSLKRDREITIRVPRARFQNVLAQIDKIGDVLHRDIQAQDVTDEYVDLEVRIKNARAMQARLKELLERAAVKEALEIEKELHRVTEELERLEGKLKLLKDKVAYSTITVSFEPRTTSIQATRVRMPFSWLGQLGLPSLLSLTEVK